MFITSGPKDASSGSSISIDIREIRPQSNVLVRYILAIHFDIFFTGIRPRLVDTSASLMRPDPKVV